MPEDPQQPQTAVKTSRNPYKALLAIPGTMRFSGAGAIARLPMSMVGIGIVLMIQQIYGSYALGGRVSAAYIVAQAICSPQIARYVDRKGQSLIMRPLFVITSASLVGLILCAALRAPQFTLYVFAVLTGATIGSVGSMVRARWSHLLDDPRQLHSAYSFESAVDELCFVIGPMLATILATSVTPTAGLVVPLLAVLIGGFWFLSLRATEPPPSIPVPGYKRRSVLLNGGMLAVIAVFIGMGAIFGATDVATIAFAEEAGHEPLAGAILGIFALGSLISGLLYGAKHWISPLWKRFALGMVALAIGVTLFVFVTSLPVLAIVMFVTGFAIAPTLINGNNLVQLLVPPSQLTEGLTWVGTALGVGVSIGTSIGGQRIDAAGAHAGFEVVLVAAALAVLVTLASLWTLRRRTTGANSAAEAAEIA
ncbi:Predicted arabinose efflux permease, MFS family [Sanguibacter gelidistatuariae]|uniref:Predicted arabinose efflux permease, MFS family n=1 Tax=Sanguibacter gelidistatuariae TaxID=1814289 RepID=A0A1G6GYX7_9MICO|nr:MFS transporter [Sanguibacter gelidistatuariae]SDB87171.1 Predicted arabinose efflux permease, MFS family [Sanguibacter gelidistatuariae]